MIDAISISFEYPCLVRENILLRSRLNLRLRLPGFITIRNVCDDLCVAILAQEGSPGLKPEATDRDQKQKHASINGRERNDEDDDEREDESIVFVNIRFDTFWWLSPFAMPTSLPDNILIMAVSILLIIFLLYL